MLLLLLLLSSSNTELKDGAFRRLMLLGSPLFCDLLLFVWERGGMVSSKSHNNELEYNIRYVGGRKGGL